MSTLARLALHVCVWDDDSDGLQALLSLGDGAGGAPPAARLLEEHDARGNTPLQLALFAVAVGSLLRQMLKPPPAGGVADDADAGGADARSDAVAADAVRFASAAHAGDASLVVPRGVRATSVHGRGEQMREIERLLSAPPASAAVTF